MRKEEIEEEAIVEVLNDNTNIVNHQEGYIVEESGKFDRVAITSSLPMIEMYKR